MITKKELLIRICDLECVVDMLEQRVTECEQDVKKVKKVRKNEGKK